MLFFELVRGIVRGPARLRQGGAKRLLRFPLLVNASALFSFLVDFVSEGAALGAPLPHLRAMTPRSLA